MMLGKTRRIGIKELWISGSEKLWNDALVHYWALVRPENMKLERDLDRLDPDGIKTMSADEFFDFLYNKYFVWKYTAKNRLATTRAHLIKYKSENRMNELSRIHQKLFSFDTINILEGLEIANQIRGLGIAGASGLLSLIYPKYFGTIDQFAVKALQAVDDLPEHSLLQNIKPENLNIKNGYVLIEIMRNKTNELNSEFKNDKWNPRKIDMVLWSIDR